MTSTQNLIGKARKLIHPETLIVLILVIHFSLGLARLSNYAAVDEPYWFYDRVPKFWKSVANGNWYGTKINDKPGVTVALISGAGLTQVDPIAFKEKRDADEKFTLDPVPEMRRINFALRFPILLVTTLLILVFYRLTRVLASERVALLTMALIALSPILLGASLFVNPDALFWTFCPLTLLSFLAYQKTRQIKYLLLSGLFMGLSLLTKYVSNILFVFLFLLVFLDYFWREENEESLPAYLRRSALHFILFGSVSVMVYTLLFPATWAKPGLVLGGTIFSQAFDSTWPFFAALVTLALVDLLVFKSFLVAFLFRILGRYRKPLLRALPFIFFLAAILVFANTYSGMRFYDFENILGSPKSSFRTSGFLGMMLADLWALLFGISPIALAAFVFLLFRQSFGKKKAIRNASLVFSLLSFILLYYFASTVNQIAASVRYQIALYPLVLFLAALGIDQFIDWAKEKRNDWQSLPHGDLALAGLLVILLSLSLFASRPFYFAYASEILPERYFLNLKDMGDGSYEAAQYLNGLPEANRLTVWSDKGGVCDFFKGRCLLGLDIKKLSDPRIDYYVVSVGRKARSTGMTSGSRSKGIVKFIYDTVLAEHEIRMGRRNSNWVRIIPAAALPDELFPEQKFTFAIMGDAQNSIHSSNSRLDEGIVNIKKANPELTIFMGDILDECFTQQECQKYFRNWSDFVKGSFERFYPVIGNHDYQLGSRSFWESTFSTPGNGPGILGETVYSFDHKGVHFVVLNSEIMLEKRERDRRFIDNEQYDWLEKDLRENVLKKTLVFLHSPNFPTAETRGKLELFWELLDRYKIDAVFAGHIHFFCQRTVEKTTLYEMKNPIPHLIVGNTDSWIHAESKSCQKSYAGKHYAIVNITHSKMNVDIYSIAGELIHSIPLL